MFMEAMNDDLDSAKALSIIWEIARKENKSKNDCNVETKYIFKKRGGTLL